jgi:GH18 family chitinase
MRVANLKLKDPSIKVFITVGGWTFNNPGPTATTFSDLAASPAAQMAFIKSLLSFMSTYNFDGVDIDWEYPAAPDRNGRDIDYVNFPKFIENPKKVLSASGGRDGLSVAVPTSYRQSTCNALGDECLLTPVLTQSTSSISTSRGSPQL